MSQAPRARRFTGDAELMEDLERIAGYRVLRVLGKGVRATVYLGVPEAAEDAPEFGSGGREPQAVALKVYSAGTGAADVDRELAALSAVDSPHVVRLLDVAVAPGGPYCLVLERLAVGPLGALLHARGALPVGEAVTILIAVVRAVADLHDAGFVHGAVSPSTIMFDRSGRPVLIGLGASGRLPAEPARPAPSPAGNAGTVAADWQGVARVARLLSEQAAGPQPARERLAAVIGTLDSRADSWQEEGVLERLEERLFAVAPPAPVRLAGTQQPVVGERQAGRVPAHLGPSGSAAIPGVTKRPPVTGMVDRALSLLERARSLRASLKGWLVTRAKPRRRVLWFAGGLSGALVLAAVTLVPSAGTQGEATQRGSVAGAQPASAPASADPVPPGGPPAATGPGTTEADPVVAAAGLLKLRADCLSRHDTACLAATDQAGSAVLQADLATRASGGAQLYAGYRVSLIERNGNTALVALTPAADQAKAAAHEQPASALLIKDEAGWRLRDVFAY